MTVSMPSKVISQSIGGINRRVELNLEQYEDLVKFSAGIHKSVPANATLKATVKSMMATDSYKEANFRTQGSMMSEVLSKYKELGKALFLGQEAQVKATLKAAKKLTESFKNPLF